VKGGASDDADAKPEDAAPAAPAA